MLTMLHPLREITLLSVVVRMLLAAFCGGIIGIEREFKRRAAGFRTHILICLGAAITTLTSQYLCFVLQYDTDLARMGAQVVAGIGFMGAGTIIVTRRQRVKGLTTAAGLWTAAIIGLCVGSGFLEGALYSTGFILLAEMLFSRLEYRILDSAPEINLYMEYTGREALDNFLSLCREEQIRILDLEITRSTASNRQNACAIFTLRLPKTCSVDRLLRMLAFCEGIVSTQTL